MPLPLAYQFILLTKRSRAVSRVLGVELESEILPFRPRKKMNFPPLGRYLEWCKKSDMVVDPFKDDLELP